MIIQNDFSEKIIESYKKSDSRIKSLQNKGKGIVSALNHGIEEAMSEIIIRMDADDAMMPERIGEQVHHLEANPQTGLVSSQVSYVTDFNLPGEGRGYALYVDWINQLTSSDQIKLHRFEESPLLTLLWPSGNRLSKSVEGTKKGIFLRIMNFG
jgi:glycosyltransferase involved in cell wall biosynthesis